MEIAGNGGHEDLLDEIEVSWRTFLRLFWWFTCRLSRLSRWRFDSQNWCKWFDLLREIWRNRLSKTWSQHGYLGSVMIYTYMLHISTMNRGICTDRHFKKKGLSTTFNIKKSEWKMGDRLKAMFEAVHRGITGEWYCGWASEIRITSW